MPNPIDLIRQRLGLATDAEVAQLAGVIFQAVGSWRARGLVPQKRVWRIADRAVEEDRLPESERAAFVEAVWRASEASSSDKVA